MITIDIRHHHVSLAVLDLDAQEAWYGANFGFTEAIERLALPDLGVRTVVLRAANGLRVELIERAGTTSRSFPDPLTAAGEQGYGHWALAVDDLDAIYEALIQAGGTAVSSPAPAATPGDRYAYVHDPEGNLLELIQPA